MVFINYMSDKDENKWKDYALNYNGILYPTADIYNIFDLITISYSPYILGFAQTKYNIDGRFLYKVVFGSGFLVMYRSKIYIVTAKHVVDDIFNEQGKITLVSFKNSVPVSIDNCYTTKELDVAIIPCSSIEGFSSLKGYEFLDGNKVAKKFNVFFGLFIGYPASKNKLKKWNLDKKYNLMSISAKARSKNENIEGCIKPLIFDFDIKRTIPGLNRPRTSISCPKPKGMSGGPMIGLGTSGRANTVNGKTVIDVCHELMGISIICRREQRILVAEDISVAMFILEKKSYL